ncbi:MAG: hypothetical protein LBS16_00315 [Prevotellaceae bacterium]|nr:hypothetical protein [Prevotellaceae bacterium]
MKQKTFLFAALTAAFLSVASFSAAQVTIGGSDAPKAGAILDLNSTTKGGLALSNVSLTDLNTIPVGFPGINNSGDVTPEVKAKLTGAIVYNINPKFCLGVYVWDGNCWRKIDKDYQAKAAGVATLDIADPDKDAILGGEAVTFEVKNPGDAQFYYWYLNNVLLDTTDTRFLITTAIPSGDDQEMKVVLDNCLSLSESKITFNARNISPSTLPSTGGERWIRIYGGDIFPYAATTEYAAQSNLVAHFDGIDNTGAGDKNHSFDVTTGWQDLKNPTFKLPRGTGTGEWLSNGFQVWDDNAAFYSSFYPDTYPSGNESRTVEVIFRTPEAANMFEQENGVIRIIFSYGTNSPKKPFAVVYRGATHTGCTSNGGWVFHAIGGNSNNLMTCLSSTPSLTDPNTINTVTSTYENSINDAKTNSYINNNQAEIVERLGCCLETDPNGTMSIGEQYLSHSTFLSFRLYDRVLTSGEIQHNAALDQKRYLDPPTVTIGGSPCTNVTVLSPRVITCLAPSAGSAGKATVIVDKAEGGNLLTLPNEFEFLPLP